MRKPWRKIALALLLSLSCFAATHFIYEATAPDRGHEADRIPIAYVSEIKNEVGRRPIKRSIWQQLGAGEPVYPGEAIRTSADGEAQIRFVGGMRRLDLEPDSLIVLTKTEDEIALELLDGNVTVAQNEAAAGMSAPSARADAAANSAQTLTLKSAAGKVDLSKATASLSKAGATGALDLQVLKGTAQITTDQGQTAIEQGQQGSLLQGGAKIDTSSVKLLSPKDENPIFVPAQNPGAQDFSWSGGPENTRAEIWLGTQRKNMYRVATLPAGSDSVLGQIRHRVTPGKYFWKVVFTDDSAKTYESLIARFEVQALPAPPIVQPAPNESITLENEGIPIRFQWSTPEGASEVTLEFSNDRDSQKSGFGKVLFTEKLGREVSQIDRALPSGKYRWRASAFYPEYNELIVGVPQEFEVWVRPAKVINISWNPDRLIYYPLTPTVNFNWVATEDPDIVKWRMRLADSEEGLKADDAIILENATKSVQTPLPKAGRWMASIEALDKNDKVLGKSPSKSFELEVLPLLNAPIFTPDKGQLKASNSGQLDLAWTADPLAKSYTVTLKSEGGRQIASQTLTKNKTGLADLMPGTYKIEIFALDEFGRKSQTGEIRSVIVPASSGLSAPKVKSIKVNR